MEKKKEDVSKSMYSRFEDLKISTETVMVYSNVTFDFEEIFKGIKVIDIDPPLTSKKKNIDKKKLHAPYGSIFSVQKGLFIRGIRMSKSKQYWCPVCQLTQRTTTDQIKEVHTVVEKVVHVKNGLYKIEFLCKKCEKIFNVKQLGKISPFLNQLSISLSIGDKIIQIMLFADKLKLAGNGNFDHALETIMILWEDHIQKIESGWSYTDNSQRTGDVKFLFETVMRNLSSKVNFPIDKLKLNKILNDGKYSEYINICQFENTSATHVNVKILTKPPKDFKFNILVYENAGTSVKVEHSDINIYSKEKEEKEKCNTFIIFSSGQIIIIGRYFLEMKSTYDIFMKLLCEQENKIEEKIEEPKLSIREFLKLRKK